MKIARIFPRRTKATPNDPLSYSLVHNKGKIKNWDQCIPGMYEIDVNEVHISTTFTYDKCLAEELAEQW